MNLGLSALHSVTIHLVILPLDFGADCFSRHLAECFRRDLDFGVVVSSISFVQLSICWMKGSESDLSEIA